MKKSLPIIALSAVVAVLCSCAEITPKFVKDQAINFVVDAQALTKGDRTTIENLNQFKVSAITGEKNYFSDMLVTSSDKGQTWTVSDIYYWPNYEIAFYAYANANGAVTLNGQAQQVSGYTVPAEVAQQKDFVVAYNVGDAANNAKTGVKMAFQHATAGLKVNALAENSNYVVTVYGVKVGNFRGTDNFTFPRGTVAGSNWEGYSNAKHDAQKTVSCYKQMLAEPVVLTTESKLITSESNNFFVIPQTREKWAAVDAETNTAENQGAYISLLVKVTTKDGVAIYPKNDSYIKEGFNAAWDAVGVNVAIEPGKVYTYTIKFFGNGGGGQQDPDEPEDPGKGGDPILKGVVKYEVSVADWEAGATNTIQMQ